MRRDTRGVLAPLAEAQRMLLDMEARADTMPRHEFRERMALIADLLRETVREHTMLASRYLTPNP